MEEKVIILGYLHLKKLLYRTSLEVAKELQ